MPNPLRPHCFGSPTTFSPLEADGCRECPLFAECARVVLRRVKSLGKKVPLADLENYLLDELERAGYVIDTPTPVEAPTVSISPPARDFERIKRATLLQDETTWLATLPVKVARRLRPLLKAGALRDAKRRVQAGENPFPKDGAAFLHVGMDALLQMGRIDKADLRALYQNQYGWSDGTAFSHVAVATGVYWALDLIEDRNNCLVLRQASNGRIEA